MRDRDAVLDGLALIECAHREDLDGARVILDNSDLRLVCAVLARVACDLVEDLAEWNHANPADLLTILREHHE